MPGSPTLALGRRAIDEHGVVLVHGQLRFATPVILRRRWAPLNYSGDRGDFDRAELHVVADRYRIQVVAYHAAEHADTRGRVTAVWDSADQGRTWQVAVCEPLEAEPLAVVEA